MTRFFACSLAVLAILALLGSVCPFVAASPVSLLQASSSHSTEEVVLVKRDTPTPYPNFPSDIPSCPICQANYNSISSCAQACPVLANFSMILFNPGAFVDVIKCACTDTFESTYPQCVDCFERTNQTALLNNPDLSGTLNGLRTVCGAVSTTVSNVTHADNETVPTTTPVSNAAPPRPFPAPLGTQTRAVMALVAGGVLLGVSLVL